MITLYIRGTGNYDVRHTCENGQRFVACILLGNESWSGLQKMHDRTLLLAICSCVLSFCEQNNTKMARKIVTNLISLNFERLGINKQGQHLITPVFIVNSNVPKIYDCFHHYFSYKSNQIQQPVYMYHSSLVTWLTSQVRLHSVALKCITRCISPPHLINSTSHTNQLAYPIRDICYTHPWRC